jgi:hypothetical protein
MKEILAATALASLVVALASAQDGGVVIHDLASAPFHTRGALQLKGVITDDGSIAVAVARGGVTQAGHNHAQEQVVMPIEVAMDFSVAGVVHRLDQYGAAIPPSDAHHFYATAAGGPATFIEYQPVRRDDWAPPFPPNASVRSPEPKSLPSGRVEVTRDLSPRSSGWSVSGVARTKEFAGDQIKVVMIELSGRGTIEIPAAATGRQFVYVITGKPSISAGTVQRELGAHTVVEMNRSARSIRLEPPREGQALVAVFSRIRP